MAMFIVFSIPLALDIRAIYGDTIMLSPNEITNIAQVIRACAVAIFTISVAISVRLYFLKNVNFWLVVFESFLFYYYIFVLAYFSVLMINKFVFKSDGHYLMEFIGASIVFGSLILRGVYVDGVAGKSNKK